MSERLPKLLRLAVAEKPDNLGSFEGFVDRRHHRESVHGHHIPRDHIVEVVLELLQLLHCDGMGFRNLFFGRLIVQFVEIFELAEAEGIGISARRGLSAEWSRYPPLSALE